MTEQPSLLPVSTGSELALLREARGLGLDDVAERLRCSPAVVEALETHQPTGLAPIYAKGYLRRYAELLELDDDSTEALLEGLDIDAADVRTVFQTRPPVPASERWLRVSSYALASLLVGTLAWQMAHEAVRVFGPEPATPNPVSAAAESEAPEGAVAAESHVNASIGGLESLHAPAGSRTGNAGLSALEALEDAREQQSLLAPGEHLLELETSADTWVEIHGADDLLLEQDLLRGGDRRTYRDTGPFRISLGRATAVSLQLDGEPVPLEPYTRDGVARLRLDPLAFRSSMQTREGQP